MSLDQLIEVVSRDKTLVEKCISTLLESGFPRKAQYVARAWLKDEGLSKGETLNPDLMSKIESGVG